MSDAGPFETQRDVSPDSIERELEADGFADAHEMGHGGFGVVYRCAQDVLDRTVAVKVLTAALVGENLDRFLRGQRAMGRLSNHPNIASVYRVGSTERGRPYIVMEYFPRNSLDLLIRSGPRCRGRRC